MKTLLILRHAKSSWKNDSLTDHDRPLNKRGKRDAPRVGELLLESQLKPDVIISSTAKRARKTASKVAKSCGYEGVIELTGELYLAEPDTYIEVLRGVPQSQQRVMVVGHNPGMQELVALLTGHDSHLPTAALAQVDLEVSEWSELSRTTRGKLVGFWLPSGLH